MRALGHLFLWGGFLAASFLSVRIADRVEWPLYGAAVAVATLGVVLLRLSSRRAGLETDKLNANSTILSASLERLTTQIDALLAAREQLEHGALAGIEEGTRAAAGALAGAAAEHGENSGQRQQR